MEYHTESSAHQRARIAGQIKDLPTSLPHLPAPGLETCRTLPSSLHANLGPHACVAINEIAAHQGIKVWQHLCSLVGVLVL